MVCSQYSCSFINLQHVSALQSGCVAHSARRGVRICYQGHHQSRVEHCSLLGRYRGESLMTLVLPPQKRSYTCKRSRDPEDGSKYPIFEVSDSKDHVWYGFWRSGTPNTVYLDLLGSITRRAGPWLRPCALVGPNPDIRNLATGLSPVAGLCLLLPWSLG